MSTIILCNKIKCFKRGAHDRSNRLKASTPTDGAAVKSDYAYTQRKKTKNCNGYDNSNSNINNA